MKRKIKQKIALQQAIDREPKIQCDFKHGLSSEQVEQYVDKGLINKTKRHVNKTYASILFTNLFSYFNILLFIIAIFMAFAELYSGMFFVIILIANIAIGLVQDIRARRLTDKLKIITEPHSIVIRNSKEVIVSTSDIVFNDVLLIKAGNQIPVDAVVLHGVVKTNESMLTGESVDVLKKEGSIVYGGSYVTSGTAYVQVTKIGPLNFAEELQNSASSFKRPKSEILKSTNILFKVICIIVTILGTAMIVTAYFRNGFVDQATIQSSIESISGSMVAMIPSGMYLLTSLTLAVGVITLAKRRMLVQELYCIESLARVNVLCLDKTGTLTDGSMSVKDVIYFSSKDESKICVEVNSLIQGTKDENATAKALMNYFGEFTPIKTTKVIAFSSDNKYSAATLDNGETIVIGAPEFVCKVLDKKVSQTNDDFLKRGYRTILVATSKKPIVENHIPQDLTAVALIVIKDNICVDAYENIKWFKDNGVKIKIISGDNPITVSEIAKEVGVDGADKYVSLEGKTKEETFKMATEYDVFGRTTPEQKEILIDALHAAGMVVAMTGDGVNDILALKKADCSIAMARGSDAAKDASYLVSLDSNFSSLPKVVKEGRRVINNLQRTSSLFLVKTMFAITLTIIFLIGSWFDTKTVYPFSTRNMYVWEILTIGIAAFFLALQPNNEPLKGSFLFNILVKSIPAAIVQILTVVCFYTFCTINSSIIDPKAAQAIAQAISVIGFTFLSYVILFRICWPFNAFRIVLYCCLLFLGITAFVIDGVFLNGLLLDIDYTLLNGVPLLLLILCLLIATPLYFFLDYFIRKIVYIINRRKIL